MSAGADDASIAELELRPPTVAAGPADIVWAMPEKGPVRLAIFDVQGRRVADLVEGAEMPSGEHRTAWSTRSDEGAPLARGVYFVRLETAAGALTRHMVLLGH